MTLQQICKYLTLRSNIDETTLFKQKPVFEQFPNMGGDMNLTGNTVCFQAGRHIGTISPYVVYLQLRYETEQLSVRGCTFVRDIDRAVAINRDSAWLVQSRVQHGDDFRRGIDSRHAPGSRPPWQERWTRSRAELRRIEVAVRSERD